MKIVRYLEKDQLKLGAVNGEYVIDLTLHYPSLGDDTIKLIQDWNNLKPALERARDKVRVAIGRIGAIEAVMRPEAA